MKEPEKQLLEETVRGAQRIFENARDLYNEAQLLGTNGAFARSLTLHQISMEECSKVDMLGVAAISVLMDHSLDLNETRNQVSAAQGHIMARSVQSKCRSHLISRLHSSRRHTRPQERLNSF